ncbi:LuxR C-terminal-related transcriptional regulator [Nocardia sp. R6R-6]|uniref:LuxR C-terminal-related transcriptional regulator n=1 Tax=Nocardia sp. R6R-6 TaxID=3459303 RepID=UPI00403DB8CD
MTTLEGIGAISSRHGAPPRFALDERQRSLVALLLAGHTDSSAARRLGVSPRTVTNIIRSLMNRLGVNNRFQLGVALGARMDIRRSTPHEAHQPGFLRPGADQARSDAHAQGS